MNPVKMKVLEELLEYLNDSQGKDLKSLLSGDEKENPEIMPDADKEIGEEMPSDSKGLQIEKVSLMGKPKGLEDGPMDGKEDEPNDEELEELLKKIGLSR